MGKPEALVVGPAMVRPPRPASRERPANGTPEPPAATAIDSEVVVIDASPEDEFAAPSAPLHEPPVLEAAPRRTGSVPRMYSPDAVTVPLAVVSPAPLVEATVLDLPMAALEKP